MLGAVSEKILPQPASFNKKKQYEIHEILGTGTFGKVMVRVPPLIVALSISRCLFLPACNMACPTRTSQCRLARRCRRSQRWPSEHGLVYRVSTVHSGEREQALRVWLDVHTPRYIAHS